ncbi:hypothetical protein BD309DRAFT_767453 [Dichomitus squalens]|uniref:WKF domain-containing protein n=1 Tax=Dichomitus squalens TaxID=114155 RepID=A0A4Q9NSY7_9APHY|nr:hypothetical protein BD309DRAFT_767453 [Dichomitus squalens]TBU64219.1 hypothetical protein BD310DRAFT_472655 [Dichomitus squalens]
MSTASPDKPPRKNKKNREPLSEADPTESEKPRKSKKVKADKPAATSSVDTDASHPLVEPEKTEKKKKRKHAEEEGAVDFSKSTVLTEEAKEKKKKRKHGEAAAEKSATGVEDEGEDGERRRKKRKKHAEHPDGAHTHQKDAKGEGKADGDVDAEERPATTLKRDRKKKDKKKRKDADDGEEEEEEGEAAPKKKSKKKRKRSSASGFPDPTEDESLSEQARKALEYAFTQFEDPGSWKFHKARQNWLIRNIWSEEAIPDTYIPLATRYLQGVQGGAREVRYVLTIGLSSVVFLDGRQPQTLVKTCQEALQPPQLSTIDENTLARDEASSSKPVQTKEPTDAPLKTKRTVKFTVEGDNAPADSINDTKRQRAATLLAALTS